MLNHIVIMGRLTRAPELRHTQTGTPVASFTLAVERDRAPQGGERETDFIDIVAWRGTAEFVSKHFTKGQLVAVSGRLQIRDWTDTDGHKRRNAEVVADSVYFAEGRRDKTERNDDTSDQGALTSEPGNEQYYLPGKEPFSEYYDDGDLPF